ncbi:isopentenyl phosphate kinase [Metallosphaera sedula]|uniref:Isopentenyl phosphate kinase n=4 Tax=Metallosphaera TaxID=41980 RepID=A4YIM4_METS5|nr:isopentenyl phosphate kinase [Metallosphaera sedula]MCY0861064.1 isopentenyl phosphate kinase [Metallosphaera prunae]ABP96276.1 isopentenyl phosphate kinase [Metallosphaera sedula DSM 5348]AIM28259.1 isopentenyl phosphate kinase [Metallosphaera sedula]QCO31284.1 uridylate kinase [Metallosphaera prunae]BBL48289.1 isopentenyl phosphate kinase [Metallosphaera sedula]
MGKPNRVIKLGGSAITCKAVPYCADLPVIRQIAGEIKDFVDGLVIVHGGGSFGHFEAGRNVPVRVSLTSASMEELNTILIREMAVRGIKGFPLPGRFFDLERLERILDHGMVPVVFGDIKEDGTIISGDDLTISIAREYSLTALFATDVDGILVNGQVIPELNEPHSLTNLPSLSYDLTGGMREKVRKILQNNINAMIFNGKKRGNVFNALKGERIGTLIKVSR